MKKYELYGDQLIFYIDTPLVHHLSPGKQGFGQDVQTFHPAEFRLVIHRHIQK